MIKGNSSFKWSDPGNKAFKYIKNAIANALILCHPNYKKDFVIYYYPSKHTLSTILMQENRGVQAPIVFMNIPLKNHELRYS